MNFIYIHRANFDKRPPVISCVNNLLSLGHNVILITTGITDELKRDLEEKKAQIIIAKYEMHKTPFQLLSRTIAYRRQVKKILKNLDMDKYILWIEGNYTFTSLIGIINKYFYILQIQELHKNKIEYVAIKKLIGKALLVFMPEYNRTFLYKNLFKLKRVPSVLPNKPDFIPQKAELALLKEKYPNITETLFNKKIILYQGLICEERDLSIFIKAFLELTDYIFVLLGKDYGILNKYKQINPNIIHIPYLSAPDYLFVTSMAHIGIVTYIPDSLNTIYCAPNKIFEYAAYGIPIIANNIPGLRYPIQQYGNGVIIDDRNPDDIIAAVRKIESKYETYSQASSALYNSVNNKETIQNALSIITPQ